MEKPKSILQALRATPLYRWSTRRSFDALEAATLFDEPVAVVEASLGVSLGLLALTDSEIVYATSRASRKPKVVRWNRDAIEDVTYQLHQTSGTLAFSVGGTAQRFRTVSPVDQLQAFALRLSPSALWLDA